MLPNLTTTPTLMNLPPQPPSHLREPQNLAQCAPTQLKYKTQAAMMHSIQDSTGHTDSFGFLLPLNFQHKLNLKRDVKYQKQLVKSESDV